MSSSLGSTFSSGVQDVSAILPLMGTDQCESHVTSGLQRGFLYPAATTLSIFGSLGAAKAGLMIAIATSRFRIASFEINGAEILKNTGFGAADEDGLADILLNKTGTAYGAEERMEQLIQGSKSELKYEDMDQHRFTTLPATNTWNIYLTASAACLSILGIIPYIHLNLRGGTSHSVLLKWFFPSSRVVGSFLVAVAGQLVMQHRFLNIVRRKLIVETKLRPAAEARNLDERLREVLKPSNKEDDRHTDRYLKDVLDHLESEEIIGSTTRKQIGYDPSKDWPILSHSELSAALFDAEERPLTTVLFWGVFLFYLPWILVLVGSCLVVVGYVGCFSIVQGTTNASAPLIWLGLEISLSILRMFLWATNPSSDEDTGVHFMPTTVKHSPPPTCADYAEYLEKDKLLPLTTRDDFFQLHLMPYLGPCGISKIYCLQEPSKLFYTFTRCSDPTATHRLYITVKTKDDSTIVVHRDDTGCPLIIHEGKHQNHFNELGEEILDQNDSRIPPNLSLNELERHYNEMIHALDERARILESLRDPWLLNWTLKPKPQAMSAVECRGEAQEEAGWLQRASWLHSLVRPKRVIIEKDVEKGKMDAQLPNEPRSDRPDEALERMLLSFGGVKRYRRQLMPRLTEWVEHHLLKLEEMGLAKFWSTPAISKGSNAGSNVDPRLLLDWLVGLEVCLAAEWTSVEWALFQEYNSRLRVFLETVNNLAVRARLRKILHESQKAEMNRRLEKAKQERVDRISKLIPTTDVINNAYVTDRIREAWNRNKDLELTAYHRMRRQMLSLVDVEWYLGSSEDSSAGDRLFRYLNTPESRKLFEENTYAGIFYTARTDLAQYVINDKTVHRNPDLVLRRNRLVKGIFFDVDLTTDLAADRVVRSCIESLRSAEDLDSIGFGSAGLRGVTAETMEALRSLLQQLPSIRSLWFAENSASALDDAWRSELQKSVPELTPIITYHHACIEFMPEDKKRQASVGSSEASSFTIDFKAPKKPSMNDPPNIALELYPFGSTRDTDEVTITVEHLPDQKTSKTASLEKSEWTTVKINIDSLEWDKENRLRLTVPNARVGDIRLGRLGGEKTWLRAFGLNRTSGEWTTPEFLQNLA